MCPFLEMCGVWSRKTFHTACSGRSGLTVSKVWRKIAPAMPLIITDRQRLLSGYPSCYCCDRPKTSREHVPPLCFFPDEKDKKGAPKYRKNLIRVPSCDQHNMHK